MGRISTLEINTTSNNLIDFSGVTLKNIHIFIDENGNVTQIENKIKSRLKYYPDQLSKQDYLYEPCVIGISDPVEGSCSEGWALGGDDDFDLMFYANYG